MIIQKSTSFGGGDNRAPRNNEVIYIYPDGWEIMTEAERMDATAVRYEFDYSTREEGAGQYTVINVYRSEWRRGKEGDPKGFGNPEIGAYGAIYSLPRTIIFDK